MFFATPNPHESPAVTESAPDTGPQNPEFSLTFPYSLGCPPVSAGFRSQLEDFQVVEDLGFAPAGSGEHLLLQIRKRNENTRWVARLLGEHYGIPELGVGYCGLKDRRAVTSQWFSVQLPGADTPAPPSLPGCELLASARHPKKLRPGMHRGNDFAIVLRVDPEGVAEVQQRLEAVARQGVPNYFGEQRFGRDGNNLREVARIVGSRQPRFKGQRGGLYLSAARAWLFNLVLGERVRQQVWTEVADGPLWGRGRSAASETLARDEAEILAPWAPWCLALEHSGLKQERRPLVLAPQNFVWHWQGSDLHLAFSLPPGTFATSLLRELAQLQAPPIPHQPAL